MTGLLVRLYPGRWRASFGEEFTALLEETRMTPSVVLDVVVQAGKLRAEHHRRVTAVLASLLWSSGVEYLSVRAHLTANILWAPTTPARALALGAATGPWLTLVAVIASGRRGERDRATRGSAA